MPENSRPETPGQALRSWGRAHPTLLALQTLLPSYAADGRVLPPGLYVDHLRTPWVAVRGEIRVSLARVIAVTREGRHQLIGQVQVTAGESSLSTTVALRYYIHQPAGVIAREVTSEPEWWLSVLEAYYRLGGAPLDTTPTGVVR